MDHGGSVRQERQRGPTTGSADRQLKLAGTLALALAVSTFLMVIFGTLAPFITADLGLSRTQLGALTTALFATGSVLSLLAGPLVDAFGGRRLLAALFAIGAASFLWVALAPSYGQLLVGALFGGLAVALGNPSTNALVSAHVPGPRQGVITGLKQSGVQVGVFLGGALLPALATLAGWRAAAASGVLLPAVGLLGVATVVPPDAPRDRGPRSGVGPLPRAVRWLACYGLAMGVGVAAIGAYLPLYAVERLGMEPAVAGLLAAVSGAIGVVARIAWGGWADRSSTPPARSLAALAAAAVVAAALLLLAERYGAGLAWASAVVAGASASAWNAVGMLAIVRGAPLAVAGRASGVVLLGFYFGYVVGPPLFGLLVDRTNQYAAGWGLVLTAFAAAFAVAASWARTSDRGDRSAARIVGAT